MKLKKASLIIISLFVIIMIVILSRFYTNRRTANHINYQPNIFTRYIDDDKPFELFLTRKNKIVINNSEGFVLDNNLYMMLGYIDNTLVIANKGERNIVLVNNAGEITKIIGHSGAGPGEFMEIDSFTLSPDKLIYVYDYLMQRFTVFDFDGNLKRIIKIKNSGIQVRRFFVSKNHSIFIHHPPTKEYPSFITIMDSSGNVKKNLRTDINWDYNYYYQRGFLDGDLLLTGESNILEANDFSYSIYLGNINNKFIRVGDKPENYSKPPKLKNDSPDELIKAAQKMDMPLFFMSYGDSIYFQYYLSSSDKLNGHKGYLRLVNKKGYYMGITTPNIAVYPNLGDPSYIISIEPRIENNKMSQRIPYNFIIYKWKSLKELEAYYNSLSHKDTVNKIYDIQTNEISQYERFVGIVSQNDCATCDEILISELKNLKAKLKNKKDNAMLLIVNSGDEFLKNIQIKYGKFLEIKKINSIVNLYSPSLYYKSGKGFKSITIHPDHSDLKKFMETVRKLEKNLQIM